MKARFTKLASRMVRLVVPVGLLAIVFRRRTPGAARVAGAATLLGFWSYAYAKYRKRGVEQTAKEWELLRTATIEGYSRHYNERVPTIEEEFEIWGEYHQHRHEMRYDLVADHVRNHCPSGGAILDVGCGSALVADRILDLDAHYVGVDFGGHHVSYAKTKLAAAGGKLVSSIARCDAEALPFRDEQFDVIVMSEVIEHLLAPDWAVWEVARVLKPGGVFIMTTNNASEVPLYSPLSHLFAWLEKAAGADHPSLISTRPVVWPEPLDKSILPPGFPNMYLPHTHHIQAETRAMFAAAGMDTFHWSSFEFPPPQAATSRWLHGKGEAGKAIVDVIEAVAQRTPVVRRLGCHLLMVSRKRRQPVAATPPRGIWPGPFSDKEPVAQQAAP